MGKENENQDAFLEKAVADANVIQEMALDNAKKYLGNILSGKIEEELERKLVEEDSKINKKLIEQEDEEEKDADEEKEEEKESKEEEIDIDIDDVLKELKNEMDEEEIDEDDDMVEIDLDELSESMELEDEQVFEVEDEQIFEVDIKELENELGLVAEQEDEEEEKEPEEEEEDEEDEMEEIVKLKKKNKKYKNAIKTMQEKLNESIFLNTKLKYANLLTSAKALTEDQKQKIINTFDRCDTVKEVKLAFVTLVEAFDLQASEDENTEEKSKIKIKEGASRVEKQTIVDTDDNDEEIINEQKFMKGAKRLQKVAGIRD